MVASHLVSNPMVAVLGGGQLGRMLGLAGVPLGVRFRFLDPSPDAPAGVLGGLVVGGLGDDRAVDDAITGATVITYEWEGVPSASAERAGRRAPVRPGPRALEVAQDRLREKETFRELGIPVPAFAPITDGKELRAAVAELGLPAVLKTRRGGYDGKGQRVLRGAHDVDGAADVLEGTSPSGHQMILEAVVPFARELSVLAVRGVDGAMVCYPLIENEHREGILRVSRAPAPGLVVADQHRGEDIASKLLAHLDYVGVLAVELFEHEGELLASELAPRVHNSGHWTIEGAATSQFENHLRAILGWPLGSPTAREHAAMVNCLGRMPDRDQVLAIPGAHLHDYEKAPRPGRKVGHVTITADTETEVAERVGEVRALLPS
jgi:5-(carboxyamino)imidazole ribonucleotide synthase